MKPEGRKKASTVNKERIFISIQAYYGEWRNNLFKGEKQKDYIVNPYGSRIEVTKYIGNGGKLIIPSRIG